MRIVHLFPAFLCGFIFGNAQNTSEFQTFKLNLGSCHNVLRVDENDIEGGQRIWTRIKERQPDGWIWGGDNIYADFRAEDSNGGTMEDFILFYSMTENLPEYQKFVDFIGQENIAGTWDDHDFGLNNAGEGFVNKDDAQVAFLDFFQVASDDPRRTRKGVYNSKYYFDDKIKVILLDNRYHRDDYSNSTGDFLGEEQWQWLEAELNTNVSNTEATIIVTGLQILADEYFRNKILENWARFELARTRLLDTISRSTSSNVILISGDIHAAETNAAKCGSRNKQFVIPEMTTSGMTHSLANYNGLPLFIRYVYAMNDFPYNFEGFISTEKNFGELEFYFHETDTSKSYVKMTVFNIEGKQLFSHDFMFDELKSKDSLEGASCRAYYRIPKVKRVFRYFLTFIIPVAIVVIILVLIYKLLKWIFQRSLLLCGYKFHGMRLVKDDDNVKPERKPTL